MISPEKIKEKDRFNYDLDELIQQIDEDIENQHGFQYFERCYLSENIPFHIRNDIANLYIKSGWTYVYHTTFSEIDLDSKGTIFIFSEYEIDDEFPDYFKVLKNETNTCLINPFIVMKHDKVYQ